MVSDTLRVFLDKYRGKESTNTSEGLSVSLSGNRKLLPDNDTSNVLGLNDQYNKERENCTIIRLTCQVNPVCSNVLFNRVTEIVRDEGSSGVSVVNYGIGSVDAKDRDMSFWSGNTASEAIRDTQLSNQGFVYHCGLNILNNHLIRSNTFKTVCYEEKPQDSVYNTIEDKMRRIDGSQVSETIPLPIEAGTERNVDLHLYEIDDILTFEDTVKERLIKKHNGWVGFYNKSKIKSYNDKFITGSSLQIEKPLMYHSGSDFVDMYPDRSLYSFVPKYNKFRKRIEKNWNYCITYPSSSYTPSDENEPFSDIIDYELKSLKAACFDENTRQDNGTKQLVIYSGCRHGLNVGDYVNIYKTYMEDGERVSEKILDNAEVTAVADDFIFTVFTQDVQISTMWVQLTQVELNNGSFVADGKTFTIDGFYAKYGNKRYCIVNNSYVNIDDNAQNISYKKVVNDIECDYYVRIFSRLPNFKYASGDTSSEYEIYRDRGGYNMIDIYGNQEYEFENHISRLAFAKNIYTDEIGQVVFTDDIDIANIKDNLGRPLTSLYLTFVKNNAGYKEWYGFNYNDWNPKLVSSSTVEYSHCFGKVKCGFEMSYMCNDSGYTNNINKLTYEKENGLNVEAINGERGENRIEEDEVSFSDDIHYYGDISYYDNYNAIERHIQPIMHRVNTAQREAYYSQSTQYSNTYTYDEIQYDDYDLTERFTVRKYTVDGANNKPEGYFYVPHYEIPIRTFGLLNTTMPDFLTMRSLIHNGNDGTISITTLQNHHLTKGDKAILYDKPNRKCYYCTTVDGKNDTYKTFTCKVADKYGKDAQLFIPNLITGLTSEEDGFGDISDYALFKMDNIDAPSYARILEDGTCRVIWRNVLNNGFSVDKDEIEEYPFTNGAFYINKRIDIYLRRQDPYGEFDLYEESDIEGIEVDTTNEDNYVKEDEIEC